jgi:hypothetical protein
MSRNKHAAFDWGCPVASNLRRARKHRLAVTGAAVVPLRLRANVASMRTAAPGRDRGSVAWHRPVVSEGFVKKILIKILIYSLKYRQISLLDPRRCVTQYHAHTEVMSG